MNLSETELLQEPRLISESGLALSIANTITPSIAALGYRLVRVRLTGLDGQTLQIMAEKPDGTMNVGGCEMISQTISPLLDVDDVVKGAYYLEVSSPGIDRPLVRTSDFIRFIGHDTKVDMLEAVEARKRFRGFIEGVEDGEVLLRITDTTGDKTVKLPMQHIDEARLVMTEVLLRDALRKAKAEEEVAAKEAAQEQLQIKGPGRFSARNPVAWKQKSDAIASKQSTNLNKQPE